MPISEKNSMSTAAEGSSLLSLMGACLGVFFVILWYLGPFALYLWGISSLFEVGLFSALLIGCVVIPLCVSAAVLTTMLILGAMVRYKFILGIGLVAFMVIAVGGQYFSKTPLETRTMPSPPYKAATPTHKAATPTHIVANADERAAPSSELLTYPILLKVSTTFKQEDSRMAKAYRQLKARSAPSDGRELLFEQRQWIIERDQEALLSAKGNFTAYAKAMIESTRARANSLEATASIYNQTATNHLE